MNFRKRISKVISVIFVLTVLIGTNVFASNNSSNNVPSKETTFLANQNKSLENNKVLREQLKNNKEFNDNFAGVYIDEQGNLNVNYAGDVEKFKNSVKLDNVIFHAAKYQYNHLENVVNMLNNRMVELDIRSVELDEKNNKVVITIDKMESNKVSKIKAIVDSPAMEVIEQTPGLSPQFTTNVVNGSQAITGSEGSTVGCGVSTTSGVKGFLIPGHISSGIGSNCSVGGSVVGTINKKQLGGAIDASFVKCNSGYTPCKQFNNGDTYVAATVDTSQYGLVTGLAVYGYGSYSGKQYGHVLSTNYSSVVGGISMTNMVKCDYKAVHGDSGAGVAYYRYVGSASSEYDVMGVQSFSSLDANGNWGTGSYSAFSRIDYIFNALGLQNP